MSEPLTKQDRTDLRLVLDAVNRGREALGMRPLEALPKGVPGSSEACVLAMALTRSIDEAPDDPFKTIIVWVTDAQRAMALADAWDIQLEAADSVDQDVDQDYAVALPGRLARFHREFCAGRWPEFSDPRRIDFETLGRDFGLDKETVALKVQCQIDDGVIFRDETGVYVKIADAANELIAVEAH